MRRVALSLFILAILANSTALADNWTETFDTGVGKLDQTSGQGSTYFTWDSPTQSISVTSANHGILDRRYAGLGKTYDAQTSVMGFSAVVTPTSSTAGTSYPAAGMRIGFFNSTTGLDNHLAVTFGHVVGEQQDFHLRGNYSDGTVLGPSQLIPFTYGTTYFLDVLLDGPNNLVTMNAYEGTDATGLHLATINLALDPAKSMGLDILGISNPAPHYTNAVEFNAYVDDVSLIVPRRPVAPLEQAIIEKLKAIEKVDAALEKERQVADILIEMFRSRDYGDLTRQDIKKALAKNARAIFSEKKAKAMLNKSIDNLEDALTSLGWEPPVPIAHWKFDEGDGTIAEDWIGGNDGTLVNGPTWTAGQIDGALSFDGTNDYVDCGNDESLNLGTEDFTITGWFKTSCTAGSQWIVVKFSGPTYGYHGYRIIQYHDNIELETFDSGGSTQTSFPASLITDGNWHHIVGIRNSSSVSLWLDGTLAASGIGAVRNVDTTYDLVIGIGRDKVSNPFTGSIDDVRIYDTALTTQQVQLLYQGIY